MNKYTDRALLVMLTLGKCVTCFVYKWACMHKVYTQVEHWQVLIPSNLKYLMTPLLKPDSLYFSALLSYIGLNPHLYKMQKIAIFLQQNMLCKSVLCLFKI